MLKSQENHKMEDKVVQLKQIIEEILFSLEVQEFQQKAVFRILEVLMDFITRNTNSHRKKLLVILSI